MSDKNFNPNARLYTQKQFHRQKKKIRRKESEQNKLFSPVHNNTYKFFKQHKIEKISSFWIVLTLCAFHNSIRECDFIHSIGENRRLEVKSLKIRFLILFYADWFALSSVSHPHKTLHSRKNPQNHNLCKLFAVLVEQKKSSAKCIIETGNRSYKKYCFIE